MKQHFIQTEITFFPVIVGAGKIPYQNPVHPLQQPVLPKLVQHSIHTVRGFVHVFNQEQRAVAFHLIRRSQKRGNHCQVSANNRAFCRSRNHRFQPFSLRHGDITGIQLAFQTFDKMGRIIIRLTKPFTERDQHRTMNGRHMASFPQRNMKRSDIAVPDQLLRMTGNRIIIQLVQQSCRSIPASGTEDGFHFFIFKKAVDVRRSCRIRTCKIPVGSSVGIAKLEPEPHFFQFPHRFF